MKDIMPLLKIMQMTRNQPMYGYQFSVRSKGEVSDLAQHHYLVTFIAWQLALAAERAGAKVNVRRVIELSLVHDSAELFGGDINFSYARAYPEARKAAKQMQAETTKFIIQKAGSAGKYIGSVFVEGEEKLTDEAVIARVADHAECQLYRWYIRQVNKASSDNLLAIMCQNAERAKDTKLRTILVNFSKTCKLALKHDDLEDMVAKKAKMVD